MKSKLFLCIFSLLLLLMLVACDSNVLPDLDDGYFVYDGTEKSLSVENLPEGATVEYSGNSAINVGSYDVTATVTLPGGEPMEFTAKIHITPAEYDLSGVRFPDAEFLYDE